MGKRRRRFESKTERQARAPAEAGVGGDTAGSPKEVIRLPILYDAAPPSDAEPPVDESVTGVTPFWKERRKS